MAELPQKTPVVAQTLAQLDDASDQLDTIIASESTALDVYQAALDQKGYVDGRISTLDNLQLVRDTDAMQARMPDLTKAKSDLDAVLKNIVKASDVVDGVSKLLTVVDAVVAAAKAVA